MEPVTRSELFMATAAGEYDGTLPAPVTREEVYWQKIIQKIEDGNVTPDEINAAIEDYLNTHDADIVTEAELAGALAGKVDAVSGKGLTDINYSADEQAKVTAAYEARHTHGNKAVLDGISAEDIQAWDAAQPNVNADWNANSGDAQILHKPDLSVYALAAEVDTALAGKVDKETGKSLMSADEHTKLAGLEAGAQVNTVTGVKGNAENDYRTGEINISPANIGLGNVDNTSDANKPISTAAQTALDGKQNVLTFDNAPTENSDNPVKSGGVHAALAGKISTSAKGVNGGVAELDANGKVPSSQLPSYVDDVLSFNSISAFPATGEDGKIYIAKDTNLSYRWAGADYAVISPSLALGDTSATAYRGDWGAEDRAAIGTLTDLQTMAKSNLVAAVNEVKTALGNMQSSLTFDNVPTENSDNPVKSGGIYTALAGKQDTLSIDSAPTSGSENPVESGGVYTALSGKQNTLTFDSAPTENSTNPVTSGGIYNALSGKADATTTQTALNAKQNALTAGANIAIGTVNDVLTISATDTTYSAGTGISISNGEISNAAPHVKPDWNAAAGADAEILNKPAIPSYSAAVASSGGSGGSAGLMSAADKEKLDGMQTGARANVQADWAQDDSTADDYILHKPDLSQLPKFSIKVVSDLPVSDISYTTIYLVPITNGTSPDMYTEYIRVKGENGASDAWEALGTQTVDLSDYVTTTAMNTALNGKAAATHTHTSLAYGTGLGTNLNSYTSTGVWIFGDLSSYTNKPTTSSENGVLIVFSAVGAIQIFLGGWQKAIYYRCQKSGTWQAWVKVTTAASS